MAWKWYKTNRLPGYENIAQKLGSKVVEKDDGEILKTHKHFKLFKIGRAKKIKYILYHKTSHAELFKLFEFSYVISTGKSSSVIYQHVFSIDVNNAVKSRLPLFVIKPQNLFHSIGKWFGMQDIEFVDYAQFNKNYLVSAFNAKSFIAFINENILGFLSYEKGWTIESDGKKVILYKSGKRMNEEMVVPFLEVAKTIYELLVGHKTLSQMDSIPELKKKPNEKKRSI